MPTRKTQNFFRILMAIFSLLLIAALALTLPLTIGVWLPDILTMKKRTLAEQSSPDGSRIRVVQYWNNVDFYNTELEYRKASGDVKTVVLDADDSKQWEVELRIEQQAIIVLWKDGRKKKVSLPVK